MDTKNWKKIKETKEKPMKKNERQTEKTNFRKRRGKRLRAISWSTEKIASEKTKAITTGKENSKETFQRSRNLW